MRLSALEVSGFRGFPRQTTFDLDASAVIVVGANGQGKTSLLDAILWSICGRIPRLGDKDDHLISMYAESGEARVSVTLKESDSAPLHITRRFDGETQHVVLDHAGTIYRGETASLRITDLLWPASVATTSPDNSLTDVFTRSVYLQQDLVREFVETDDDQRRFSVVSELCGTGRIGELQQQLERSRNGWTRRLNLLRSEVDDLTDQLVEMESALERLHESAGFPFEVASSWDDWWPLVLEAGITERPVPQLFDPDAPTALDRTVRELRFLRQKYERAIDLARSLAEDIEEHSSTEQPDPSEILEEIAALQATTDTVRETLLDAQRRAADKRRVQVAQKEDIQDLGALAQIALRHLDARCPVCDQEFDRAAVEQHLSKHIARSQSDMPEDSSIVQEIQALATELSNSEQALEVLKQRFQQAEAADRELALWNAERDRRLKELGVDVSTKEDIGAALSSMIDDATLMADELSKLEQKGETLSIRLAQAAESARREEMEKQAAQFKKELGAKRKELQERQATGEAASRIIEQLREASLEVVGDQLAQIGPLLQRIYATADPHPAFQTVRLFSKIFRGKGHLAAEIGDVVHGKTTKTPELVLSSSQLNAFAVSIFLSLNLGFPSLPLSTAMLDDPLQSLDDVNLLGLIDLLRRLTSRRQLIVSTHDSRFGQLLQRKLRPVSEEQRTRVIELEGWGRGGPQPRSYDVDRDLAGLRIVAA